MKTVEQCKLWWEKQAEQTYFTKYSWNFSAPELIEKMSLNSSSYILEIGCGYGRELSQLTKISNYVHGIDISKTHVELAKKHVPSSEVKEYDGLNIPYPDNFFNFIYNCFVMQHMSKNSAQKLMKDMLRVLKPQGKILLEFFGAKQYEGKGDMDYMSGGEEGMYNNGFTLDEIIKYSDDAGFKWQFIHIKNMEHAEPTVKNYWLYAIKKG